MKLAIKPLKKAIQKIKYKLVKSMLMTIQKLRDDMNSKHANDDELKRQRRR